jgi:chemotaxis protein histidine kinase CheA
MTDNTFVAPDTDNLDDFSALMFGSAKPASEPAEEPKEPAVEDNVPEDVPEDSVEVDADVEVDEDDLTPEPEPEVKPKKKTAQDRINELIAKQREAERTAEAEKSARASLEAKLAALEAALPKTPEAPKPEPEGKPSATALNEDGTMKYPLGEFDPTFISDITRWTIDSVTKERQVEAQRAAQAQAEQQANAELEQHWQGKLAEAEKVIPDLRTKGQELVGTFADLNPDYGQFLAQTIMQMDAGPEVLYHLANHLDEAQAIINKGPVGAALALGRLEARFAKGEQPKPRVSSAPKPAPTTRGVAIGGSVPGDTDDLDAFSAAFFAKKGRK